MRIVFRTVAAAGLILSLAGYGTAHGQSPPDAELAEQMAQAVPELRARLPQTTDEITTWTGISAQGTQFIYEFTVSVAIAADRLASVRQLMQDANQTRLCADTAAGALIRRGASMRHIYTDTEGKRIETLITGCPSG